MAGLLKRIAPLAYGARRRALKLAAVLALVALPVDAEPVVIAALGDSLTQGYGLAQGDGFVPQLEAWLTAQGAEVELINAGVSGDTTAGGLSRVGWTLTPEVDAMIVALGGNDLLRGIDPATSRANLEGVLSIAQEKGVEVMLVGLSAPGNYGPDYKAAFDAMYPDLAEQYDTLLVDSFLAGLRVDEGDSRALRALMQPDGIHPNAEGVRLIVEAMGPSVLNLVDRVRD
ncbi:acyl-CoA thioesterase-1 [Rhodovulum iodosum]|uniref:Acyl-CoA thioesterase-1 n=1 Tax=Rhodovulum iodosum TaxID=68291 RepID=A0ABV3XQV3_9RHOB|nr:arylesterase [Rhodovulum robiginosum]RSK32870.1 arylesterase [Rhodovulum robiginosum]